MWQDKSFSHFAVFPITGAIGADIRGIDLGVATESEIDDVKRVLTKYHAVAVRDQSLTLGKLREVSSRFGKFSGNPVHKPVDGYDEIVRLAREPNNSARVVGEDWHMDLAFMEKPPGITILYGEEIPPLGGDTIFANLALAYRHLSPRLRTIMDDLVGIHSGGLSAKLTVGKTREGASDISSLETEHPMVCLHPETGERYLFVSRVLQRFKGMTEAESRPIIEYLFSVAIRPEYTCRIRWEQGTLAMWANPYVLHAATNDWPSHRRVAYRTTIEGRKPVPANPGALLSAVE